MQRIVTFEDSNSRPINPQQAMNRSQFSIKTMSKNFRHLNARIGVIFDFQERVVKLLFWNTPAQTMSFLVIYSIVCLDPYLICIFPFVILMSLLINSYLIRYPSSYIMAHDHKYHSSELPCLHGPSNRSIKERSITFMNNMRGLQDTMGDYTLVYDRITNNLVPLTNFSNEALSSTLFLFSFISILLIYFTSHFVSWRSTFVISGWILICINHPSIQRRVLVAHERLLKPYKTRLKDFLDAWSTQDISLDLSETREVEVFEIQHHSSGVEWEPWLFSRDPFDPSSESRTQCDRPKGTRYFEDVQPPSGWQWTEKKWALDLWSREWVEERLITGVEIETEGERWVYDLNYDRELDILTAAVGVGERWVGHHDCNLKSKQSPSWEESSDSGDIGQRRGRWRRRRWVRIVKRK